MEEDKEAVHKLLVYRSEGLTSIPSEMAALYVCFQFSVWLSAWDVGWEEFHLSVSLSHLHGRTVMRTSHSKVLGNNLIERKY